MCFTLCDFTSNMKVHGGISTEGEFSSMVEDALPQLNMAIEDVSWELFEEQFRRGNCLRNSLSTNLMSSTPYDRVVV
jgi:hypothetical protein